VKIGMLANAATVRVVAETLGRRTEAPVVLDPVLAASSGGALLDAAGRAALRELMPRVRLLTPNVPEAAALLGEAPAADERALLAHAQGLLALGAGAVLLKGGHGSGDESTDWLVSAGASPEALSAPRLAQGMRGSGCALASAIAAYLAHGLALAQACRQAKEYVTALMLRSS
jgi:hydroxymethylpyrimidine/phosphomethylpyrimidine kinase